MESQCQRLTRALWRSTRQDAFDIRSRPALCRHTTGVAQRPLIMMCNKSRRKRKRRRTERGGVEEDGREDGKEWRMRMEGRKKKRSEQIACRGGE